MPNSGERWAVVEHLGALHGKGEPVEEYVLHTGPPVEPAAELDIAWEISFEGARARVEREGRPLFLYYRGHGLSGLAPLVRALQWGLTQEVREAASRCLHALAHSIEFQRYLAVADL